MVTTDGPGSCINDFTRSNSGTLRGVCERVHARHKKVSNRRGDAHVRTCSWEVGRCRGSRRRSASEDAGLHKPVMLSVTPHHHRGAFDRAGPADGARHQSDGPGGQNEGGVRRPVAGMSRPWPVVPDTTRASASSARGTSPARGLTPRARPGRRTRERWGPLRPPRGSPPSGVGARHLGVQRRVARGRRWSGRRRAADGFR